MSITRQIDSKVQEALLTRRRVEGDRVLLSDEVLLASLEGTRHLTEGEREALAGSPLTLRRLRALVLARRRAAAPAAAPAPAPAWSGSHGMLRAAAGGEALAVLATDDGHWALHFIDSPDGWRVVLTLDGAAPFALRLLRDQPLLRVLDGAGAIMLQGRLDADGECESVWPFETAPAPHFHQRGAGFSVEPAP